MGLLAPSARVHHHARSMRAAGAVLHTFEQAEEAIKSRGGAH
jgi:hypothetical protein